jgi:HEAT repeats
LLLEFPENLSKVSDSHQTIQEVEAQPEGRSGKKAPAPGKGERKQFSGARILEAASIPELNEARLEESLRALRYAESPKERAAAALDLGSMRNGFATANLVAALFDSDDEVRTAAAQALDQIGDPSVAVMPMRALVTNEPETLPLATPTEHSEINTPAASAPGLSTDHLISPVQPAEDFAQIEIRNLTEQETAARRAVTELETQAIGLEVARASAESEVRLSAEREARLHASVTAMVSEERELRERADEIATRRTELDAELRTVQTARSESDQKVQNLRAESERVRQEAEQLRLLAEQYSREIIRAEAAQKQTILAAQIAETEDSLRQTEAGHRAQVARLQKEEEELQRALERLAVSRVDVDTARQDAEKQSLQLQEKRAELAFAEAKRREEIQRAIRAAEAREQQERDELRKSEEALRETVEQIELRRAQIEFALQEARDSATRLSEVQARIQSAEDARRQDEAEYARLEAEASQQAQEAIRKLESMRIRFQEEQQRLEEQAAQTAAEEERRLAELDSFRNNLEAEARRRSAREKAMQTEIQQLLQAEAHQREKIERAENELREVEAQHRVAEEEARIRLEQQEREYELRRQENAEARLKSEEEMRRRIAQEQNLKHEAEEAIRQLKNEARREAEKRVQRIAQLDAFRQQLATTAAAEIAREEHLKDEIEELQKEEQRLKLRIQSQARLRGTIEERVQQEKERLDLEVAAHRDAQRRDQTVDAEAPGPVSKLIVERLTRTRGLPAELLTGLQSTSSAHRAAALVRVPASAPQDAFAVIVEFFDDPTAEVRNAAATALNEVNAPRSVEIFTRAIESSSAERRRKIGAAMAGSGLARNAINRLGSGDRQENYNALSLLFTMAKTGEVQPLVEAIESHDDVQVRRAAIRLLNLVGQTELANAAAKRRLSLFNES